MKKYILGYGSLMNKHSLNSALKREVMPEQMIEVNLMRHKRVWNVKDKVFSDKLSKIIDAVFLDIQPSPNNYLNGIIFEVTEEEIERLSLREKNYEKIEVTKDIKFYGESNLKINSFSVFTFMSLKENRVDITERELYVMNKYLQKVEQGCKEVNQFFYEIFKETTNYPTFEVLEGDYKFVDLTQSSFT